MGDRHIPADQAVRELALDPSQSFVVQAPAGSGKTELLTQRFLRLLTLVDHPGKVLAVTFTRKATRQMLDRIVGRLKEAASGEVSEEPHLALSQKFARAVLERDQQLGWGLLENPNQLQIHTIDGLCARIAARGSASSLAPVDLRISEAPLPLYREAARRALDQGLEEGEGGAHRLALEELLIRVRGDGNALLELLAEELGRRDQWLESVTQRSIEPVELLRMRQRLELAALEQQLGSEALATASELLLQLARLLAPEEADLMEAARPTGPDTPPERRAEWLWRTLRHMATGTGTPYAPTSVNKNVFPGDHDQRDGLIDALKSIAKNWRDERSMEAFQRFVSTPALDLAPGNDALLGHLRELLKLTCAHLNVIFAEAGQCDFQHVAQQAIHALGGDLEPGDALLIEDGRLEHVLIDEFQDTSALQFSLTSLLVEGWTPGDGRSLFLVGDPMQSIYGFRKANVALFLEVVRQQRLAQIPLTALILEVNFRSRGRILQFINEQCADVLFSRPSAAAVECVDYTPVAPFFDTGGEVVCRPFLEETAGEGEQREAEWIAQEIRSYTEADPDASIGVLAATRKQLGPVAAALTKLNLVYEAVDVQPLGTRPLVLDLHTLTRALLHPGDRVAWLGVLLGPWCTLPAHSLVEVAGSENFGDLLQRLGTIEPGAALSKSEFDRVQRVHDVLSAAVAASGRVGIAERVEAAWIRLGGPLAADKEDDLDDAERYLRLLDRVASEPAEDLLEALEERMNSLYAASRPARVQLMTIHKAKGLEFDAVFLPALQARSRGAGRAIFRHQEVVGEAGAGSLMAPLKSVATSLPSLYQYLGQLSADARESETQRLFYVALTRARRSLYLTGCCRVGKRGEVLWGGNTFMGRLAGVFEPVVQALVAESDGTASGLSDSSDDEKVQEHRLRRICELPEPAIAASAAIDEVVTLNEQVPERDRLALGEALHRWLELMHQQPGEIWDENWFAVRPQALDSSLLLAGARTESLSVLRTQLQQMLKAVTDDPSLMNELSPDDKPESLAEVLYLVPDGARIRRAIIDRLYQNDQGDWVIVDYKTGADEGQTRDQWNAQLARYGDIVQRAEAGRVASHRIRQVTPAGTRVIVMDTAMEGSGAEWDPGAESS